ncbi:hypothetical protein EDB81DRAFT_351223 [Dactylonectria macrodidyma]|uniref:Uncharacterized protein n=1 Tax=Dactylonectria macrodidyma TaxID=307937 RepID=A0A9P9FIM9_9HYPO|nr:hypothetical protein EDB81DRAFT_351223 [Dactylonectria macrodidyma]
MKSHAKGRAIREHCIQRAFAFLIWNVAGFPSWTYEIEIELLLWEWRATVSPKARHWSRSRSFLLALSCPRAANGEYPRCCLPRPSHPSNPPASQMGRSPCSGPSGLVRGSSVTVRDYWMQRPLPGCHRIPTPREMTSPWAQAFFPLRPSPKLHRASAWQRPNPGGHFVSFPFCSLFPVGTRCGGHWPVGGPMLIPPMTRLDGILTNP